MTVASSAAIPVGSAPAVHQLRRRCASSCRSFWFRGDAVRLGPPSDSGGATANSGIDPAGGARCVYTCRIDRIRHDTDSSMPRRSDLPGHHRPRSVVGGAHIPSTVPLRSLAQVGTLKERGCSRPQPRGLTHFRRATLNPNHTMIQGEPYRFIISGRTDPNRTALSERRRVRLAEQLMMLASDTSSRGNDNDYTLRRRARCPRRDVMPLGAIRPRVVGGGAR